MNSLFNEYEAYTDTANKISGVIGECISEILKKYGREYSTIEIEKILIDSVSVYCAELRIEKASKKRKAKRNT